MRRSSNVHQKTNTANGALQQEVEDIDMNWSTTTYKLSDLFTLSVKLPFYVCEVTSPHNHGSARNVVPRVFRVGQLVSQNRVTATDIAKNRIYSYPILGLDLQFKIFHGRKWYDFAQYRPLHYITSKYRLPIIVNVKRSRSRGGTPDMTSPVTLNLCAIYQHKFLAVNYIQKGVISQNVNYIDVNNDVTLYRYATIDHQADDHVKELIDMFDRSIREINFSLCRGPSEIFEISEINGTAQHEVAMVTPSPTVSSNASFVFSGHKSARINRETVAPTSGATDNVAATSSGQTANGGDKAEIDESMQVDVQQVRTKWRRRRPEGVTRGLHSVNSLTRATRSRAHTIHVPPNSNDMDNEITMRTGESRGESRDQLKKHKMRLSLRVSQDDVSDDVTRIMATKTRDHIDNAMESRDRLLLSRDLNDNVFEVQSRDQTEGAMDVLSDDRKQSRGQIQNELNERDSEISPKRVPDSHIQMSAPLQDRKLESESEIRSLLNVSSKIVHQTVNRDGALEHASEDEDTRIVTQHDDHQSLQNNHNPHTSSACLSSREDLNSHVLSATSSFKEDPFVLLAGNSNKTAFGQQIIWNTPQGLGVARGSTYRSVVAQVPPYRHEASLLSPQTRQTMPVIVTSQEFSDINITDPFKTSVFYFGNESQSDKFSHDVIGPRYEVGVEELSNGFTSSSAMTSSSVRVDTVYDRSRYIPSHIVGVPISEPEIHRSVSFSSGGRTHVSLGVARGPSEDDVTFIKSPSPNMKSNFVETVQNRVTSKGTNGGQGQNKGPRISESADQPIAWKNRPSARIQTYAEKHQQSQPETQRHLGTNAVIEPRRHRNDERVKFANEVIVQNSDGRAQVVDRDHIEYDGLHRQRLGTREHNDRGEPVFRPRLGSEYVRRPPPFSSAFNPSGTLPSRFRSLKLEQQQQQQQYDDDTEMRVAARQRYRRGTGNYDVIAVSPAYHHQVRLTAEVPPQQYTAVDSPSPAMNRGSTTVMATHPARNTVRRSGYDVTTASVTSSPIVGDSRREQRFRVISTQKDQWQRRYT